MGAFQTPSQPLSDVYPSKERGDATFEVLSADSPDGRYKLVFDGYQYIGEEDGEISIGGEPDSAPLLLDLRQGTSTRLAECGTVCGFHWGSWISPTRFILAGWHEIDPKRTRHQGTLRIYSIRDSAVTFYLTREVSSEEFSKYQAAWEAWVAERYHALKLHAVRDGADLAKVAAVAR
jgi:hypothetical protein